MAIPQNGYMIHGQLLIREHIGSKPVVVYIIYTCYIYKHIWCEKSKKSMCVYTYISYTVNNFTLVPGVVTVNHWVVCDDSTSNSQRPCSPAHNCLFLLVGNLSQSIGSAGGLCTCNYKEYPAHLWPTSLSHPPCLPDSWWQAQSKGSFKRRNYVQLSYQVLKNSGPATRESSGE